MNTTTISRIFMLAALAIAVACNTAKKEAPQEHDGHDHAAPLGDSTATDTTTDAAVAHHTVAAAFQQQLASVFQSYVALKEAFIASDAARVQSQAQVVQRVLSEVNTQALEGAARHDWTTYAQGIQNGLLAMRTSPANLEDQRKAFSDVTRSLYQSIKAFGIDGQKAYYEFCPMAFNNQGGFWLSESAEIRNPYFGDKMLTCGEVRETL